MYTEREAHGANPDAFLVIVYKRQYEESDEPVSCPIWLLLSWLEERASSHPNIPVDEISSQSDLDICTMASIRVDYRYTVYLHTPERMLPVRLIDLWIQKEDMHHTVSVNNVSLRRSLVTSRALLDDVKVDWRYGVQCKRIRTPTTVRYLLIKKPFLLIDDGDFHPYRTSAAKVRTWS